MGEFGDRRGEAVVVEFVAVNNAEVAYSGHRVEADALVQNRDCESQKTPSRRIATAESHSPPMIS